MADGATLTDEALREEVRAWLAANWTPLPEPPAGAGGAGWTTTPERKAWQAKVVEAQAQVPLAMAEAFRSGRLGVMDYYKMENIQSDTAMRQSIAQPGDKK